MAEHLDGVSHDTVSDFLRQRPVTARQLWHLVRGLIQDDPSACLIVDASVQDQRYSRLIERVKRQYSGNEHGLVRGIGIVNLIHSTGLNGDFWPIDYRHAVADRLDVSRNTIGRWFATYAAGGLAALLQVYRPAGKQPALLPDQEAQLLQALRDPSGLCSHHAIQ